MRGPDNSVYKAEIVDNQNGTFGVVFEPKDPGNYRISVKYQGEEIKDSPFTINIGGGAPEQAQKSQQPAAGEMFYILCPEYERSTN